MSGDCPVCGTTVELQNTEEHEIVECDICTSDLEVYSMDPVILEEVPEIQEDWGE